MQPDQNCYFLARRLALTAWAALQRQLHASIALRRPVNFCDRIVLPSRLFYRRGGPSGAAATTDSATVATEKAPAKPEIPEGYKILKEGKASILQKGNEVFYNEAQVRY
jgi:hypothetical protein